MTGVLCGTPFFCATETHVGDSTAVYSSYYSYTFHPGGSFEALRVFCLLPEPDVSELREEGH